MKSIAEAKSCMETSSITSTRDEVIGNLLIACDRLKNSNQSKDEICEQIKNGIQNEDAIHRELVERLEHQLRQKVMEVQLAWTERDAILLREQVLQSQLQASLLHSQSTDKPAPTNARIDLHTDDIPDELVGHKLTLLQDYHRLTNEVNELNRRLNLQRIYAENVERKRAESENKNIELFKVLDESSTEIMKEKMLLEQLKIQVTDLTKDKSRCLENLQSLRMQNENLTDNNKELTTKIERLTSNLEQKTLRLSETQMKLGKSERALKDSVKVCGDLGLKLRQNENLLNLKESEIKTLTKEHGTMMKAREALERKLMDMDASKALLNSDVLEMKNLIHTYEKEQEATQRAIRMTEKQVESIAHERDALHRNLQRADAINDEQRREIKLREQGALVLQNEINAHLLIIQEQQKLCAAVEKERNRYAAESRLNAKRLQSQQIELEIKMARIDELIDALTITNRKLANVQKQLDDVSAERTSIKRELALTTEDRELIRYKLSIATNQCAQLTEETSRKEQALHAANKNINNLKTDIVALKADAHRLTARINALKVELKEGKFENEKLHKTLSEDEKQFIELLKTLEALERDKDLVGSQLVRRNNEIALLNEKIQINQMAIDRGEREFNIRLENIRLLKIKIGNVRQENDLLKRTIENTADMRLENLRLNRVLLQERMEKKALEEEMTRPINIHRWRQLGGSDPDHMQLITANQTLQRKLIKKSTQMAVQSHYMEIQTAEQIACDTRIRNSTNDLKRKLSMTTHRMNTRTLLLKMTTAECKAHEIDAQLMQRRMISLERNVAKLQQSSLETQMNNSKLKSIINSFYESSSLSE